MEERAKETGEPSEDLSFTRRDIREFTSLPDHQVKAYIRQLEELEYLTVEVRSRGQFAYRLNNPNQRRPLKGLLTPEELAERLSGLPAGLSSVALAKEEASAKAGKKKPTGTTGRKAVSTGQSQ